MTGNDTMADCLQPPAQRLTDALQQLAAALGPNASWAQAQALVRGALGLVEVDAEQCLHVCSAHGLMQVQAALAVRRHDARQQDASHA